jgi:transcriptional regulator with XRE-family HTH domain
MHERAVTTPELARKARLTKRAVEGLLSGSASATLDLIAALARGLGVSPAFLAYGTEAELPPEQSERRRLKKQSDALPYSIQTARPVGLKGRRITEDQSNARRANLQAIMDAKPEWMTAHAVGRLAGMPNGAVYRVLNGDKKGKNLGTPHARRLEEILQLDKGAFDGQLRLTIAQVRSALERGTRDLEAKEAAEGIRRRRNARAVPSPRRRAEEAGSTSGDIAQR